VRARVGAGYRREVGVVRILRVFAPVPDDLFPPAGVGGEDAVVAVAVESWRRDQPGQAVEKLEGGQAERGAAVSRGTRQMVDEAGVGGVQGPVRPGVPQPGRPPGHHANNTGREEGFCFYSNAAIAARYAQRVHGFERVLILDWDYHHGNATQNAFYDDPTVLFFSTHDWQAYPGTGDPALTGQGDGTGFNINRHLDCGARDLDMLRLWDQALLPAVSRFQPDFIIVSAGFDSRRDDLLGCFDLTDDVFRRMTRTALELADEYAEGRLVSLLEGGYNVEGNALAAAAHLETLIEGS
jgi:hypothetical protein